MSYQNMTRDEFVDHLREELHTCWKLGKKKRAPGRAPDSFDPPWDHPDYEWKPNIKWRRFELVPSARH